MGIYIYIPWGYIYTVGINIYRVDIHVYIPWGYIYIPLGYIYIYRGDIYIYCGDIYISEFNEFRSIERYSMVRLCTVHMVILNVPNLTGSCEHGISPDPEDNSGIIKEASKLP